MSRDSFPEVKYFLGRNIRSLRKSKGYTLKILGEKINISSGFLSDVETGKKVPGGEVLYSLKKAFNVQIDSLFEENGINETLDSAIAEPSPTYSACPATQIKYLERIIAEKDQRLADKDKLIKNLESRIADLKKEMVISETEKRQKVELSTKETRLPDGVPPNQ